MSTTLPHPGKTPISRFAPRMPGSIEALGISENLVLDLVVRRLLLEGTSTLTNLAKKLRLSVPVVDHIFQHMRRQQLVEVKGMVGNDYFFTPSASGRQLASERFQISQYAGACPVSLKEYHAATKQQAAKLQIDRRTLRQSFLDLIVTDRLLDQLGPALISQNSIFIYGPSGNGKTCIAERMLRRMAIPRSLPYRTKKSSIPSARRLWNAPAQLVPAKPVTASTNEHAESTRTVIDPRQRPRVFASHSENASSAGRFPAHARSIRPHVYAPCVSGDQTNRFFFSFFKMTSSQEIIVMRSARSPPPNSKRSPLADST